MIQILLHLFGDFIIQNDNIGVRKKEKSWTGLFYCLFHCFTYGLCFLLITTWDKALLIGLFHFIIDRWDLVSKFISIKNLTFKTTNFGYKDSRPIFMTAWLYIIQDNTFHIIINYLIIKYV